MLFYDKVSKFSNNRSCTQNPYVEFYHFWVLKSVASTFYSTPQTVENIFVAGSPTLG